MKHQEWEAKKQTYNDFFLLEHHGDSSELTMRRLHSKWWLRLVEPAPNGHYLTRMLDEFAISSWIISRGMVGKSAVAMYRYCWIFLHIYTIYYIYIHKDRERYIYYDPDIIHWEWKLQGLRMVLIPFVIIRNHQLQGSRCDGRCLIFEWRRCFAPAKQKTNKNNMSCTKRVPLEIAYFPWFHCIISILNCLWLLL